MKSGVRNNKTLKLVSATAVTLFSLLSVFVATFAWFSMNKEIDNDGMMLQISPSSGRLNKIYFHAYDDSDAEDDLFEFNKTPYATYSYNWENSSVVVDVAGSTSDWQLEDYTALDHDHPALMIFEFNNDYTSSFEGDMFIKGHTTVNGFLGERKASGDPVYDLSNPVLHDESHPTALVMKQDTNYDYYALSSVAAFRNKAFSNAEYTSFLAANTGNTLAFKTTSNIEGEALVEAQPFCDVDNAAETFEFNQAPYLFKSDGESTVKYIAVVVEYSSDAIGYIYSTYLGDPTLESWENILHFTCDWSLEVC